MVCFNLPPNHAPDQLQHAFERMFLRWVGKYQHSNRPSPCSCRAALAAVSSKTCRSKKCIHVIKPSWCTSVFNSEAMQVDILLCQHTLCKGWSVGCRSHPIRLRGCGFTDRAVDRMHCYKLTAALAHIPGRRQCTTFAKVGSSTCLDLSCSPQKVANLRQRGDYIYKNNQGCILSLRRMCQNVCYP